MVRVQFVTYACLSTALTAAVVSYAFQTRIQFYPTVIFLVTSKMSLLVLGNMGLMLTLLLGRITKAVFFGQLRDVEVEILYENARYAITETCLALTIFREELNTRVLTLFTALLFSKSFHWLCQSRVEYVESDNVSRWTHIRLVTLMVSLLVVDVAFVSMCIYLWRGPSVLILFGFEYTILALSVLSTLIRYILHVIDMSIEGNWPQKGSYIFFLEFVTEVVRFISYVIFFTIIFTYYGMPLHIVRDLWTSYVNLKRRLIIFNKYRKLTANMNERFPDATNDELAACEHTCIICRDGMEAGKKLPCGHIFHLECLRLWLQHQQSCPTCRAEIPTDGSASNTTTPPAHAAAAGAARGAPGAMPAGGGGGAAPYHPGGAGGQAGHHAPDASAAAAARAHATRGAAPHQPPAPGSSASFPHPPHIPGAALPPQAGFPPFPMPFAMPPWGPGAPPPFPSAPFPSSAASDHSGAAAPHDMPRWHRVVHRDGAVVRVAPASTAPTIRTIGKDELVLCLCSERRQADDVVVHRVLEGYILDVPEDSADTTGRRVLQPTAAPPMPLRPSGGYYPPPPSSMLFDPFLANPALFSSSAAPPRPPTASSRAPLSSTASLEEVRAEVQASRASIAAILRDLSILTNNFHQEAARLDAALAKVEATQGGEAERRQQQETS